jgi:hypothetical protein
LGFDNAGKHFCSVDLEGRPPVRVAVDPRTGAVWVVLPWSELQRYSAKGKLEDEWSIPALTAEVDPRTGNVWAVTAEEVQVLDPTGKVLKVVRHKGKTGQAWIASA